MQPIDPRTQPIIPAYQKALQDLHTTVQPAAAPPAPVFSPDVFVATARPSAEALMPLGQSMQDKLHGLVDKLVHPPEPKRVPPAGGSMYTVTNDDTLYGIAKAQLNDGERWHEIYDLNKDVIGPDPNVIHGGQELLLPAPSEKKAASLNRGTTKDGYTLPDTEGRATTFWNGDYAYKGRRDVDNYGVGAWGDANKPTDYMCAIPVGLQGGGNWWHNQKLLITDQDTGKQVVVQVQDKGPGPRTGAVLDLSPVAKEALGHNYMDDAKVTIAFADPDAPVGPVG
ncbi:MAG TPA: LysM peptidoglycan-binding domain-containing protein [Stenomitos sp.]